MRDVDDFLSAACFTRDRVNPYLFTYAYSVALLHRDDTKDVELPPLNEIFPDKFIDGSIFSKAREETSIVDDTTARVRSKPNIRI